MSQFFCCLRRLIWFAHNSDSSENSNILRWQSSWGSRVSFRSHSRRKKGSSDLGGDWQSDDKQDSRHTPGWDDGWVQIETVPLPAGRDLRFDRPCKVKRFLARAERSEPRLAEASARRGEEDRAAVKAAGRKLWRVSSRVKDRSWKIIILSVCCLCCIIPFRYWVFCCPFYPTINILETKRFRISFYMYK